MSCRGSAVFILAVGNVVAATQRGCGRAGRSVRAPRWHDPAAGLPCNSPVHVVAQSSCRRRSKTRHRRQGQGPSRQITRVQTPARVGTPKAGRDMRTGQNRTKNTEKGGHRASWGPWALACCGRQNGRQAAGLFTVRGHRRLRPLWAARWDAHGPRRQPRQSPGGLSRSCLGARWTTDASGPVRRCVGCPSPSRSRSQ